MQKISNLYLLIALEIFLMKKKLIICPTCKKKNTWQANNPFRPFCSERCKLIDLGEWASEKHRIAGEDAHKTESSDEEDKE